ncbi:MAG: efflux RND transporter periplasmic adaptor subunit [Candidatus Paceibacterota bacterium]|jgi:HlyD family secretion protein
MKNFISHISFKKVSAYAKLHKIISIIIILVIVGGGYLIYKTFTSSSASVSYVLGTVEKTTIVSSVSASGQVSTVNQIDIKPKASGDVTWVGVKAGDAVRAGQALAYIDATNAKQTIADAESSLAEAKLQYQKDSAQAPIDYEKSLEALDDAKKSLDTTYNDTYNTVSNAYLDLPGVVTGMQNILYGYTLSGQGQWNIDVLKNTGSNNLNSGIQTFADIAERDYKIARTKYDQAVLDFKVLTRYSPTSGLEKLLNSSVDTTTAIAQALQSELNVLDAVVDDATIRNIMVNSLITTMRTNARSYLSTVNSNLSALLNQQKSLDTTKKTIRDSERNIEIYKIGNESGSNPISLQSSAGSIANQERNLQELKNNLSYYTVTAPFAGTIASVNLKKFDTVSTGSNVVTLITTQKIAQLSLNEVDATKISLGDKATLTFDAIENFTLTGEVIEIDAVGTVSQGVVSYKVKIGFDSQDERIKSGMTVNSSIQTDVKQDVLAVSSSSIKTQNGVTYVQVFNPALAETGGTTGVVSTISPTQIEVKTGISDDTKVEILEGLKEGEQIVTRTISGTATANTTTSGNARTGLGGTGIRF